MNDKLTAASETGSDTPSCPDDQLARSNSDLQDLTAAADIAIVVIDRELRIRRFTPSAKALFNLSATDVGRPLSDLSRRLDYPEIVADAERSLALLQPAQREVNAGERWYLARTLPYRTAEDRIAGVILTFLDITELKRTEQQLSESEARYRAIGESIDFGVWVCDSEGRNIYASESFLRMVGITQQQCSDFGWGDVLHPDDAAATIAAWKECVRTRGKWDREHRFRGVDGEWYHVLARGVPLTGAAGEPIGWAGINLDITRLVRTEREIARLAAESDRQRRLYETVLSNTPDFVYVFSLDHRVLYANEALIKMWGRGREGAIGKTFLEIGYEPWHAEMHCREIDQVRATRQPIRGEVPFTGTNGRRMYDYIFVPVIGSDGEVEAVAGTTRDVTDRNETERQLRESEERSTFVRRSSGVGFWYCDLPFDALQWDDLVKAHFHLPTDAAVTIQTFYDLLHPDDRESTRQAIEQSIAGRAPYNVDYRTVHPDTGAVKWVRAIGRTFYAPDGTPTRFDGVTLDVSAQKQSEERQAFLIRLADTLRPLSDPVDVQAEASRVLGEHLGAARVVYFEIRGDEYVIERDYTAGVRPLAGRYPVAAFGPALLADLLEGRKVIEADATVEPRRSPDERAAFAAIQVRGHVDVPLVKDGQFVAGMAVHVSARREWTTQEVALIEDTAERTWGAVERSRVEMAWRQSEERRRLALDAAELGTWQIDLATNAFTTDERFRIIFAGTTRAMEYGAAFAAIHPDDQGRVREAVAAATRCDDPAPYAEEYRVVHPDGSVRWVFAKGRATFKGEGATKRPVSFDGTVADITSQVRARLELAASEERYRRLAATLEEQVEQRTAELEATHRQLRISERMAAMGTLSAGLGHDMGNLLMPIRVRLESLLKADLPEPSRKDVEAIRTSAEYLRRLSAGLRLLALNPEHSAADESTELQSWWEEAEPMLRNAVPRGTVLASRVPKGHVWAGISRPAITQAVFNLVQNAGDAMRARGSGTINVWIETRGDAVVVGVTDDGPGMPPEVRARCMEPFYTTKPREISTGLGLALVYSLIHEAKGSIVIDTAPGQGTTFAIMLPAAGPRPTSGESSRQPDRTAAVSLKDPRLRAFVTAELRSLGFKVESDASMAAHLFVIDDLSKIDGNRKGRPVVLVGTHASSAHEDVILMGEKPPLQIIRETLRTAVDRGSLP